IRLVCLILELTGLKRFVGTSYGTQQQVNRHVEEAIVAYRQEESTRLSHEMLRKAITLTQDETFTGGLCLVGIEPVSNYILLDISFALYAARGRAYSGSSSFSARAGTNRGMGKMPASCRASRQAHTTSSWLGASFCLYQGR